MAADFSAEYADCTPNNSTPDYFSYMNSVGERMRKLDTAIQADAFIAISANYQEWQGARDSAAGGHHNPDKLRAYLEMNHARPRSDDGTTDRVGAGAAERCAK